MAAIVLSFWLLFADDRVAVSDFLADTATDLSNGHAGAFLKHFDKEMPGYGKLEGEVQALVKLVGVGSSAQVLDMKTEGDGFLLTVDWFVELVPLDKTMASERRRELIQVKVKRSGKTWKIYLLEPQTIFNAPRY